MSSLVDFAAAGDVEGVMRLLGLERGSDSSPVDANLRIGPSGTTALLAACGQGHVEVAVVLVDRASALVSLSDFSLETPLLKAARFGHVGVVLFLLQRGADPNEKDCDGWTALHNAASFGFNDIAEILLQNDKCHVDATNNQAFTPLMNAAAKNNTDLVSLLLKYNANPSLINNYAESAFSIAAQSENLESCVLLSRAAAESPTNHTTQLEIVYESESSTLFNPSKFSPDAFYSVKSVDEPEFSRGVVLSNLSDIKLPVCETRNSTSSDWFWLTDWRIDDSCVLPGVDSGSFCDAEGWRYSRSREGADWFASAQQASGFVGGLVRRRRWVRVRKHKVDIPLEPTAGQITSTLGGGHSAGGDSGKEEVDYVEHAEAILSCLGARTHDELDGDEVDDDHVELDDSAELRGCETAIQILLGGLKTERDEPRKQAVSAKVIELLTRAEALVEKISALAQPLETVASVDDTAPTPRLPEPLPETPSPNKPMSSHNSPVTSQPVEPSSPSKALAPADAALETVEPPASTPTDIAEPPAANDTTSSHDSTSAVLLLEQHRRTSESEWKASILASAGWKLEGDALSIDSSTPAIAGFPHPPIPTPHRHSSTADSTTSTSTESLTSPIEPIRLRDSPNLGSSAFPSSSEEEDEAADLQLTVSHFHEDELPDPRIDTVANQRVGTIAAGVKTPLVPQTSAVLVHMKSPVSPASGTLGSGTMEYGVLGETLVTRLELRKNSFVSVASREGDETEEEERVESSFFASPAVEETDNTPSPAIQIPQGASSSVDILVTTPGGDALRSETDEDGGGVDGHPGVGSLGVERSPVGSWQSAEAAVQCKGCARKFGLFLRKHHCRWCGFIFCDTCTPRRALLSDTGAPDSTATPQRVCETCYTHIHTFSGTSPSPPATHQILDSTVNAGSYRDESSPPPPPVPLGTSLSATSAMDLIATLSHQITNAFTAFTAPTASDEEEQESNTDDELSPTEKLKVPKRALSDSVMLECPVCQTSLLKMKSAEETEKHVGECLARSAGVGGAVNGNRYIVQTLKEPVDTECVICFEELEVGERVARLNCLCIYHEACIKSWFKKKSSCPVHYN
ncbi:hypothetical protein HDU98_006091 [Podochytrium sp. JEL0797]|nr:hypothetical protein HDU98_006091 [Podochytrium sp. JEL0797]